MSNLQEKINKEYPIYDIPTSVSKTDEYNGNEIQFIKRSAFQKGYESCQKEYEEKLRWITVEESKPKKDKKRIESDFSIFVLVKDIHGIPQSAYYNFKKNGFYSNAFSEHEIMCVTHWRYIL